jgi:hypothetical protein
VVKTIMKTATLAVSLVACACLPLAAAPQEHEIRTIRRHYSIVNNNLRHYSHTERELTGYSTEGGFLNAYFLGSKPRKVVVQLYGCQSQIQEEYYFWNNQLFFVLQVQLRYESLASSKIVGREESRYYFSRGRLVRWLNPEKKPLAVTGAKAQRQERVLLEGARQSLKLAQTTRRYNRKTT